MSDRHNQAGFPPTLLGNCLLCSCQCSASSRKPSATRVSAIIVSFLGIGLKGRGERRKTVEIPERNFK
ncbi:hypothetical protein DPEC_G00359510 [Dallia pectoralis]|uniref:Uncharacterized protein n=1 Tax=Dallia pectoralis TaxID=75939 RepID=A0ACC2F0K2_DALPE|nr:hypothetical protein DPEC_G00359510 [Dallia pectoralis]